MRWIIGIVVGLALMFSSGAVLGADLAQARELSSRERATVEAVANAAWPDSRCHDHVSVKWSHDLDAMVPASSLRDEYMVAGYAFGTINGSCDVGIRSDLDVQQACTTGVHEAGHLAGLEHGSGIPVMGDEDGVTESDYVWPACRSVVWVPVDDAMGWLSFQTSARTRVKCKRLSSSEFRCVTSRPRRDGRVVRKVWLVTATSENGDYEKRRMR